MCFSPIVVPITMVDMTMTCISAANFKIKSLNSGDYGGGAEENYLATFDWLPAQTVVSLHQLLPLRPGSSSPPPTHGPLGLQKSCLQEKRCFHTHVSYLFSSILVKDCITSDENKLWKKAEGMH